MNEKTNSYSTDQKDYNYLDIYINAPLPFQSLDIDGYFINVNPMWLNVLGYTRDEVVGKWFGDFLIGDSLENFKKNFPRFKAAGTIENVRFEMRKKNGDSIFVAFSGRIGYTENGDFKQTYCIFRDITEETKLKDELKTIEWLLTRDKNDLNSQMHQIPVYGDLTELNSQRVILDAVGKENLIKLASDILDLLETSIAVYEKNGDYALGMHSSGWCRTLDHFSRTNCKACTNKEALRSEKWICHEDCWKTAEKAIGTKKVVDMNCSGGIKLFAVPIFANDDVIGAISVGYGNPPQLVKELKGISLKYNISVDSLKKVSNAYKRRPNYIVELAKKTIKTTASIIGTMVEKKIIENELRKSELAAKSASRAKSEFLANMSHEIRTPLNGVIGFSSLLMDSELSDTQKEYMKNIKFSADNLLDLINDVLDFSKIEAGKLELVNSPMRLKDVLKDLESIYKYEAAKKGIGFKVSIDKHIPEYVCTDQVRLRQILVNLISNAFKFTESGSIIISCKVNKIFENKVSCHFLVKDDGIGISKENQKKIFDSFTQIDGSTTRKYGGTGLGLSICNSLLKKMDSILKIESELKKGSEFYFDVDFQISDGKNPESVEEKKEQNKLDDFKYIRTILIVEDDYINRILATKFIHKIFKDCLIIQAENGKKGVEFCAKYNPDLILMDIRMPEVNGYEAAKQIRQMEKFKKIPIIAITADAIKETKKLCKSNEMNGVIIKPFEYTQFVSALYDVLT